MTTLFTEPFGVTGNGRAVTRWTLQNSRGMVVRVLDYGCVIQSVLVPDRAGRPVDVVLGYDDLAGYEAGSCWFGAVVGRYANRILGAAFSLNGRTYSLSKNDGPNHLHGVFERRVFAAGAEDGALVLRYTSPAGEEGYPGTLSVAVRYTLTEDNALRLDYRAVTDADTVVNLTNHTYFNLDGEGSGDVLAQRVWLNASHIAEIGPGAVPTGRIVPVSAALDFRREKAIGRDIGRRSRQMALAGGYDHNYILDKPPGLARCGGAYSPATGIRLLLATTQPGVQFYSGNYVDGDGAPCGKGGVRYPKRGGFCLETQRYPGSPNFPDFPSAVLRPGEEYHEITEYRFSVCP